METSVIKGIGQKRAGELADKGVFTVDELALIDETAVQLISASMGVSPEVVQGWADAAKRYLLDEIPFGENDFVSWASLDDVLEQEAAVYEHLLTGQKLVK